MLLTTWASALSPRTGTTAHASGPHMPRQCRLVIRPATRAVETLLILAGSIVNFGSGGARSQATLTDYAVQSNHRLS